MTRNAAAGKGTEEPRRSHARANRARILAVARQELGANPEATIEEIARAAGVVRRTLYAHFPSRTVLLEAIAEEASELLTEAAAAADVPGDSPEQALARLTRELWRVGDRYRTLLALGRQSLPGSFEELTDPARYGTIAVLGRGQEAGVFGGHLPAEVLADAICALVISLLESVNAGQWQDEGSGAAVATLVTAGMDPVRARTIVAGLDA